MHILITGGCGFIGSSLSLALIEKGHTVTVLDNLSPQIHGNNPWQSPLYLSIKGKVNFIEGDIRDNKVLSDALKNQDVVVHFAAETGTGQSMYEIQKYCDVNVNGTALLLDLITNDRSLNISKIVVASSRSIYGEGKYNSKNGVFYPEARKDEDMTQGDFEIKHPVTSELGVLMATDEDSKIHPSSIYGITKQQQEQMVMVVGKALEIPAVALRYQNVYGPGQSLSNPYTGILSIFSTLIKNGKSINIFEDGKESRDFVFIDDVVKATILAIESSNANYNIYNVGSGKPTDVNTVAATLKNKYNADVDIKISGKYRLGDIRHNYADINKINKDLGFVPDYDFDAGISLFVEWVNTQEIQESKYEQSISEMKEKGLYK